MREDYSDFYDALDLDFGSLDIRSKAVLRTLMRQNGYHRAKKMLFDDDRFEDTVDIGEVVNIKPTQKQLDFAWEYLKKKK